MIIILKWFNFYFTAILWYTLEVADSNLFRPLIRGLKYQKYVWLHLWTAPNPQVLNKLFFRWEIISEMVRDTTFVLNICYEFFIPLLYCQKNVSEIFSLKVKTLKKNSFFLFFDVFATLALYISCHFDFKDKEKKCSKIV